jgi:hypothetical protein
MLFVILSKRYPHCTTRGFVPPTKELIETFNFHRNLNFDTLPDAMYPRFAQIILNCFNISYRSAAELLLDLEEAYSLWIQKFEKVCSLFVRYPKLQGDVQDPASDLHINTYDPSATTAARGIHTGPPLPDAPDASSILLMKQAMDRVRANPEHRELLKLVEEESGLMIRASQRAQPE